MRLGVFFTLALLLRCGARTELGDDAPALGVDASVSEGGGDEGHSSRYCALHTGPIDDCDAAAPGEPVDDCHLDPGKTCELDMIRSRRHPKAHVSAIRGRHGEEEVHRRIQDRGGEARA